MSTVRGDALRQLLRQQIDQHSRGLDTTLARFEARSAVATWMETLRAIEEFINLPLFGLDDEAIEAALIALPVDAAMSSPRRFRAVRHQIAYRYGEAFARRFTTLLIQGAAIGHAFAQHGIAAAAGFASVGTMVGYLQSRRRHLVSLLYTLPARCTGRLPLHHLRRAQPVSAVG